jgi:hypothetical protein
MDRRARRSYLALAILGLGLLALRLGLQVDAPGALVRAEPTWSSSPEVRAADLRFAAAVTAADRAWILAAVAGARPEAQRLIDEVDGTIEVRTGLQVEAAIGRAHVRPEGAVIELDVAALNGDRALDRDVVVLHELGHVIDYWLVSDELAGRLDRGIPRVGTCDSRTEHDGACTALEERFADTFAKWALRGRFSLAGSGYGIPAPASLEDWGAPLALLAAQLTVGARADS